MFIIDQYKYAVAAAAIYPSGAAAALGLRELPGYSYTGPLIKVRRASDAVEADFYQGASAGTLNTIRGGSGTDIETWLGTSNATIPKWYDQSTNANHFSFGTVSRQPIIANSGVLVKVNGKPSTYWDDTSNRMTLTPTNTISAAENWTFVIVGQRPNTAYTLWGLTGGFFGVYTIAIYKDGNTYVKSQSGYLSVASNPTTQSIWLTTMAGTTRQLRRNGAALSTSFTSTTSSNNFTDFGQIEAGGEASRAYIQEWLIWSSDKSGSNSSIELTANQYYGIF